ncbi:MAG: NAD(P)H-hydrate dehydratase [Fusobacteriota bacterium]
MKILTARQSKDRDSMTIDNYIPGILLMENAALGTIEKISKRYKNLKKKSVLIVCGPGNNGGDGFAIARGLANRVESVELLFIGEQKSLAKDAKCNYDICKRLNIPFVEDITKNYDIIIDGIFGIGLDRDIKGRYFDIIKKINSNLAKTVSVDIASGICSDSGKVYNIAVEADMTVTFDKPKLGHFLYPGRAYNNNLELVDIGIPKIIDEKIESQKREVVCKKEIELRKINDFRHKGQAGKVLILGGNPGFTGATYMAGVSCLNMGAGLVTLGIPESLNNIFELKTDEIMTLPLPETSDIQISDKAYIDIVNFLKAQNINTILIGPGIGRGKKTIKLIKKLINNLEDQNIILDADGLFAIKDDIDIINNKNIILTPHMGEFKRFYEDEKDFTNIVYCAEEFTKEHSVILTLKGPATVISDKEKTYINSCANGGMSVGGMGDILAGMITSLVSQNYSLLEASKVGVFIHSYIGKKLLNKISKESLTPMKIVDEIGISLKEIRDKKNYEI